MKIIIVTLFLTFFSSNIKIFANELKYETSPYLLQHASNPVAWMPWGKKAFIKAQKEHKPIFLSIGYSTCHWCHVMEKESFTNKKIAALLNKYFIAVKVDREELPQIDALYENIYKKHYGHAGGWPLSVFMSPQKKVFYMTGYIPPSREPYAEGFDTLLPKLAKIYKHPKAFEKKSYILMHTTLVSKKKNFKTTPLSLTTLVASMKEAYDGENVGFGQSREFAEAAKTELMLELGLLTQDVALQKNYFALLDIMALRGLYDHVEGGFFRYATDLSWEIPHFEKMLYTQAQLIPLYVKGYVLRKKKLYKSVVQESIAMVEQRFVHNNLYYSASDADSAEGEGAYFTFTQEQIQKALQHNPHAQEIEDAMEFSYDGNFHEKVHINFYAQKRPKGFTLFQKKLREIRKTKTYPFIDKKINTAWNAMMIEALYKASIIDKKYAKLAEKHLVALHKLMFHKGELYHQTVLPYKPEQKGLLEDYAYYIAALISGYEAQYDKKKLLFAQELLQRAKEKFYKNGVWYLSDDALHIKADLNDKYYTSAVSKMLQNIIRLATLKASFSYEKLANESLQQLHSRLQKEKTALPALVTAYLMQKEGLVVVKSSKENLQKNAQTIMASRYPYIVTKAEVYKDYLACSLRQCFVKGKNLVKVLHAIDKFEK